MKKITLVIADGMDDVISVTAMGKIGNRSTVFAMVYAINDGDIINMEYPKDGEDDEKE